MSVGNNHVVTVFDSIKSVALDDTQRLSVITRKNTDKTVAANGGVKLVSECVSVPTFELSDAQILSIRDAVESMVEDAQDSLIRSLVDNGARSIADEQISFDAIVTHMVTESVGKRLRKESILNWWTNEVYPLFRAYSEPKFGIGGEIPATDAQVLRLEQTCNAWRDLFAGVAGKGLIEEQKVKALKSVLAKLEIKDSIAKRVDSKLTAMLAEHAKMNDALDLNFMNA